MTRKKKKDVGPPKDGWLVTFSDLMTLLLTFFVLLLSMASLTLPKLSELTLLNENIGTFGSSTAKVASRIEMVKEVLRDTPDLLEQRELLRDLFFPYEYIPDDLKNEFIQNVHVLQTNEGIVILLSDTILFNSGSAELTPLSKLLLSSLTEIFLGLSTHIVISGHTDSSGPPSINYALSGKRALTVLEYFLQNSVPKSMFSVSAYGEDKPLDTPFIKHSPNMARRIEITLKAK
ncbi:MAG: OmpA/MotB family protein [Desulfovibrionaceae bacterium]